MRRKNIVGAELVLLLAFGYIPVSAQSNRENLPVTETTGQKVERLSVNVAQLEAQMEANQKALLELQRELAGLREQMAKEKGDSGAAVVSASTGSPASIEEIRERQAISDSQIATHELTKVETQSKYPFKVSGLVLFNGFVNTRQVDITASPAYVLPGAGSTGFSMRQTVLGMDARGPHLLGATSHADVQVDFFANGAKSNYGAAGVLRLRTAHAGLKWPNTEAFFELDRSILEPNAPTSLLAVGQPELAWTGNLWTWNPQVGLSHQFGLGGSTRIETKVELIDVSDPRLPDGTTPVTSVSQTEQSRWPGEEARIAVLSGENGLEIGAGGYFSPHRTRDGIRYNAWAGSMDLRLPLTRHFEVTANAYRGQGLGGLGGGGYIDYYYKYIGATEYTYGLDDVGGWTQLKARAGQRMEMNAGYGIDNPFAKEVHSNLVGLGASYAGLARNRAAFGNVIWSPSMYLLFSFEYRRLWTNLATGPTYPGDVIGVGAGYRF